MAVSVKTMFGGSGESIGGGELVYEVSQNRASTTTWSTALRGTLLANDNQYLFILKCSDQTSQPTTTGRPLYYAFLYDGAFPATTAPTQVFGLTYSYIDTSGDYTVLYKLDSTLITSRLIQNAMIALTIYCDPDTAQFPAGTSYTLQIYKL